MIYTTSGASWQTSHPIVLLCVLFLTFPFDHCVVVAWVRPCLSQALFCSVVCKFGIRWTKTLGRFVFGGPFLPFLVLNSSPVKGVSRNRPIGSWVSFLQGSLSILFFLFFVLIFPEIVISSIHFDMGDTIMRIVATWPRHFCRKKFIVLVEMNLFFNWVFFPSTFALWVVS